MFSARHQQHFPEPVQLSWQLFHSRSMPGKLNPLKPVQLKPVKFASTSPRHFQQTLSYLEPSDTRFRGHQSVHSHFSEQRPFL